MREIFDGYRRQVLTLSAIIVFVIAGFFTMLITKSSAKPARPRSSTPKSSQKKSPASPASSASQNQAQQSIYAYITGEVKSPGVYKVSDDTRIFQLVNIAGGFTQRADRESINLAESVADGMHIHIGIMLQPGDEIPGLPPGTILARSSILPSSMNSLININTAGTSDLQKLPGLGTDIAKRIIDYRNKNGNFARPEELMRVRGITQAKLAQVLPYVTTNVFASSITQTQSSLSSKIDINSASTKELEKIPGVNSAMAKRIVDYRKKKGRFARPDDLAKVSGMSKASLAQIVPYVTASNTPSTTKPKSSSKRININTASANELARIPALTPAMARKIVVYRKYHGNFSSVQELINVSGFSKNTLSRIANSITVQ